MIVKAKNGLIYKGEVIKAGEEFDLAEEDAERLGYSFPWVSVASSGAEDLTGELPPLEPPKKAKR